MVYKREGVWFTRGREYGSYEGGSMVYNRGRVRFTRGNEYGSHERDTFWVSNSGLLYLYRYKSISPLLDMGHPIVYHDYRFRLASIY